MVNGVEAVKLKAVTLMVWRGVPLPTVANVPVLAAADATFGTVPAANAQLAVINGVSPQKSTIRPPVDAWVVAGVKVS
jgi:hypothetical protein